MPDMLKPYGASRYAQLVAKAGAAGGGKFLAPYGPCDQADLVGNGGKLATAGGTKRLRVVRLNAKTH